MPIVPRGPINGLEKRYPSGVLLNPLGVSSQVYDIAKVSQPILIEGRKRYGTSVFYSGREGSGPDLNSWWPIFKF
jgi:hypothetical protein